MATTTTVSSNYDGKVAGGLFLKAWKESDTLKNNVVTIYPNVNSKLSLRKLKLQTEDVSTLVDTLQQVL